MTDTSSVILQVAAKAALCDAKGRVLIVREAATDKNNTKVGKWGLPGGRLEAGEAFFAGLQREVQEETGLLVEVIRPLYVGEWRPVIRSVPHQIIALFMLCKANTTEVTLSVEHDRFAWIDPAQRHNYPMMEPDCFVVDALQAAK